MNQYFLNKDCKKETSEFLRFYYVIDGCFDWMIEGQKQKFYPGDLAVILPGQNFGGQKDILDIGTVSWIHLELQQMEQSGTIAMGKWSRLTDSECRTISRVLQLSKSVVLSKSKEAGALFQGLQYEFLNQEICYTARVNYFIDELFILIARQLTRQNNSQRDFPQTFMKLEHSLRENLSHQWTLEEMAALVGLGTTAFSEKVKNFTGFSPLNYLINIRITEAIKLLKRSEVHITDIALDVGFYSSQHFATTFKKLTGYTPSEFRNKNVPSND
jgi:AraC-like DNA-binding protein